MAQQPDPDHRRSEDDLRAAFALAAQDAPSTTGVLARLDASERPRLRPTRQRPWLPIAAVAAAVVVIAVPIGFAVSQSGGNRASSSSATFAEGTMAGPAQGAQSSAAANASGSSGVATGGPVNGGPPLSSPSAPTSGPSAGRTCTPADLTLSLAWTADGTRLTGVVTATNHTAAACDLAVKPAIYPLDPSGQRLDVPQAVSAEGYAGPARLLPGASATSTVIWFGWCGPAAGNRAQLDWGSGVATVTVTGPSMPACLSAEPSNLTSTWFGPLS